MTTPTQTMPGTVLQMPNASVVQSCKSSMVVSSDVEQPTSFSCRLGFKAIKHLVKKPIRAPLNDRKRIVTLPPQPPVASFDEIVSRVLSKNDELFRRLA